MCTFESFMLKLGLYGNIFSASYNQYARLATDNTWFKSFWEYSQDLGIAVTLHPWYLLHPAQVGNESLTENFSLLGYAGNDICALNIIKHFKGVVHLSDILLCDSKTVDPAMLQFWPGQSRYVFPYQQPRQDDWKLWLQSIQDVTSAQHTLQAPLGWYLHPPHRLDIWTISTQTWVPFSH